MLIIQALGVVLLVASVSMKAAVPAIPENTLDCHRREFTFKASQTDENGLQCWGVVTAMSCWGRCDTGEVMSLIKNITLKVKSKFADVLKNTTIS
ncbi:thyrostimulin beta-5 subunit [Caerostris darwini]|uniref:Thyrostimulin beta-5 subunit n=1 Tax=Caerostris darwini TaxID=1538125 RepID=A0AAV4SPU6_9ARAC|nr:thyrostimulin beta-5 subunit [Caerostris darwini]